ncbi:FAD-dependent thymidylate synthase [Actinocorallia libanotica]|uniref:Flavin-dependent thymidylate synthase n=1 Tax=Actinocorallia libanotica TaxID=46162 RepID=A0ABN1QQS0_9ACTN
MSAKIEFRSDMTVKLGRSLAHDLDVTTTARVSTLGPEVDEQVASFEDNLKGNVGLINYLMRERHGSPFEHTRFTFYVEAPIFVTRQMLKHRAGTSINEESGRYREMLPSFYMPSLVRPLVQTGKVGAYQFEAGDEGQHLTVELMFERACHAAWSSYEAMLARGICKEVARMVLPVSTYSTLYLTCNARSLMHFLSLRTTNEGARFPSHPQYEIELVAQKMEAHFAELMPVTYEAFVKHGRVAP